MKSVSKITAAASTTGRFTPELFERHLATQLSAPAWWIERKRAAYALFASLPMPRRGDEAWRFSSVTALTLDETGDAAAGAPSSAVDARKVESSGDRAAFSARFAPAAELTFRNNAPIGTPTVAPELAARGVVVTTLAHALQSHGDLLREHFMAQPQRLGSAKFAALHTAFVSDGAVICLPRGVEVAHPIAVAHLAAGADAMVFPHTLVIAGENSKVTVVDRFQSADGGRHFAVGANDLYAGHGSSITYVAIQDWSEETLSFQLNSTLVRRDARVQSLNLHLGGRQARHESLSQLQAPGAFSEMLALTFATGAQEFDQRTLQIHQAPNTKSDLLYKNALLDQARTIFSGLIIVDPDAQKTDAYQSNRNLMLSDDAEANSLPGLEIQANDVRCTHGATTARIDPEQAFYLESRGIPPSRAHELLVFGFFEEVLGRLENEGVHASLSELIRSKLDADSGRHHEPRA